MSVFGKTGVLAILMKGHLVTEQSKSGEVISLSRGRDAAKDTHLSTMIKYWHSMRKLGDVPRRSDIGPRGIEPLLENALIAERIAPGLARLRIAGSHLTDLMGMEVRGMPISAFVEPDSRDQLADLLTELFERPAIIDLHLQATASRGRRALAGRLLLMPLRSDLGDISRALGCLITQGAPGRAPCRFRISSSHITPVELPGSGQLASGFAEAPAPFGPDVPPHPGERPYLRLIKG